MAFSGSYTCDSFDKIRISLGNPDKIIQDSYGEVKKSETINYRTFKPERDGLFCARIFGPVKDYECLCGRYKKSKGGEEKGTICEKCGVEITVSRVRRERFGHIKLAAPVVHIWFLRSLPSVICGLLDVQLKEIERVLYFSGYVVTDPGCTTFTKGQFITEAQFDEAEDEYGEDTFTADMGAEAIRKLLMDLDLPSIRTRLREELSRKLSEVLRKKYVRRLRLVEDFINSGNKPEWMVLKHIPVIPPDMRPLVQLDGGRFASSDMNDLYRMVVGRNGRLQRLQELNAPEVIIRNEKRMLQIAVDALLDNGRRVKSAKTSNKRPKKSISDMIKGKQGRFRQNLLGKRVDYSGRSVIVVGPNLRLHQCGLPRSMALELFKPFLYSKLQLHGKASTIKAASRMVANERPEVWHFLAEVMKEHPVLLNRAPTLHRLGIQAFEPKLIDGKAIALHPLVCSAFNADFDGDQMAVHVPLLIEAQMEARVLMMSVNNILSPANGRPMIVPSEDIILGVYYLSLMDSDTSTSDNDGGCNDNSEVLSFSNPISVLYALAVGKITKTSKVLLHVSTTIEEDNGSANVTAPIYTTPQEISESIELTKEMNDSLLNVSNDDATGLRFKKVYYDYKEVLYAFELKYITLHQAIYCSVPCYSESGEVVYKIVKTTVGRLRLFAILPAHKNLPIEIVNKVFVSKDMGDLVDIVYRNCGQKKTVDFCDELMRLGFEFATNSGVSFAKDYMIVPDTKKKHLDAAKKDVQELEMHYQDGLITNKEKYNKVIDIWSACTESVAADMMKRMSGEDLGVRKVKDMNPIFMMSQSGARGSPAQMKQLAGMRGLMSKPSGEIIENPIMSNFREGLGVSEYFISTHGARKGLADTALKTANSGYLTRRLVDVSQDCVIMDEDCNTDDGIDIDMVANAGLIANDAEEDLEKVILGRVLAQDACSVDGVVLAKAGELLTDSNVKAVADMAQAIKIRSPITCKKKRGICAKCYGGDLTTGKLVIYGKAVGVIAAQSVGEPGTQLTMRTFHIGGAVTKGADSSSVDAPIDGKVVFKNCQFFINKSGERILVTRQCEVSIFYKNGREYSTHKLPYGARLYVEDNTMVERGTRIADWDPYTIPIIAEKGGIVALVDVVDGVSVEDVVDDETGISTRHIIDWRSKARSLGFNPCAQIFLADDTQMEKPVSKYYLPVGAVLSIANGTAVEAGDVIARMSIESVKHRDITGGLPRVVELFEARASTKDSAVINEVDGYVEFAYDSDTRVKRKVMVRPKDGEDPVEYDIPRGKHITVVEGDYVTKGLLLVDGKPSPHDILRIMGEKRLAMYLISEIQQVYKVQGVQINNKHIEVVIRQMLRRVEIIDPGDSCFYIGEDVDRYSVQEENEKLKKSGGRLVKYNLILQGITRASLSNESFISSASFQDTVRVLTAAVVAGKVDNLYGLKESIIVGRLMPVGTGLIARQCAEKYKARVEELQNKSIYEILDEEEDMKARGNMKAKKGDNTTA